MQISHSKTAGLLLGAGGVVILSPDALMLKLFGGGDFALTAGRGFALAALAGALALAFPAARRGFRWRAGFLYGIIYAIGLAAFSVVGAPYARRKYRRYFGGGAVFVGARRKMVFGRRNLQTHMACVRSRRRRIGAGVCAANRFRRRLGQCAGAAYRIVARRLRAGNSGKSAGEFILRFDYWRRRGCRRLYTFCRLGVVGAGYRIIGGKRGAHFCRLYLHYGGIAAVAAAGSQSFVFVGDGAGAFVGVAGVGRRTARGDGCGGDFNRRRFGVAFRRSFAGGNAEMNPFPPDWALLSLAAAASAAAAFTPGPNNTICMTAAVNFGFRRALPFAFGVVVGFPLLLFAAGAGLGGVLAQFPRAHFWIKLAGGLFLLHMAWKIAFARGADKKTENAPGFWRAVIFQWLNPKAVTYAFSVTAAFARPGEGWLWDISYLALISAIVALGSTMAWAGFGAGIGRYLKTPRTVARFNGAMGALLALSALAILFL